jgi:FMN phosphatase YigB (HAD superfamily)
VIQYIIFYLSEVLIAGLVGVEKVLSRELRVPEDSIWPGLGGRLFYDLLVGSISEEAYLSGIIRRERWAISTARLKAVIRRNLHNKVEGMLPIVTELSSRYELTLLSDHAGEWVAYIQSIHPFLGLFKQTFFSYDLKRTKNASETFLQVLDVMSCSPHNCLFIDDNPNNVRVAESVGIPSIRFVDAEQLTAELKRRLVMT